MGYSILDLKKVSIVFFLLSFTQGASAQMEREQYLSENAGDASTIKEKIYPADYWQYSQGPLLSQLVPVNQINLQPGVHLLDVELSHKQWQGALNPFDSMGSFISDSSNSASNDNENLVKLKYAFALTRFFYLGVGLGYATRWEAGLYNDDGWLDPEFFAGYHMPWQNGNFRIAITFSPTAGEAKVDRRFSAHTDGIYDSAKSNLYRGGWSLRPEAALTLRTGIALLGLEASYLYFDKRTQLEKLTLDNESLHDDPTMNFLAERYGNTAQQIAFGQNIDSRTGESWATARSTLTGGGIWAVKALIEFPEWQRLGGEFIYGQMESTRREYDSGLVTTGKGGAFQELRLYGRFRYNDRFSLTPILSWMPEAPGSRGEDRLTSVSNVIGVQVIARSKFSL